MNQHRASRRLGGRRARRVGLEVLSVTLLAGLWAPVPGAAWQELDLPVMVTGGQDGFNIIDEGTPVPMVASAPSGEDRNSGEPSGSPGAEGRRDDTRIPLGQYGTGASRVFGGIEFVRIPPGEFVMGSTDSRASADEGPVTRVRISRGFWLGKYEVTQTEWTAVMGSNPSGFAGCPLCPVERVSWKDVQEFIHRVNANETGNLYRLPTEAEWEYAARAGTTGDQYLETLDTIAWHRSNSALRTRPVGQTEPNAFGLNDVLGNVWEWVQDWKADYSGGAVTDPRGPEVGSQRVYRGCSWISDAESCRVSVRYADSPEYRFNHLGFRLLREIPQLSEPFDLVPSRTDNGTTTCQRSCASCYNPS